MFLDMATTVIVAGELGVTDGVAGGCGGGWENLRETETGVRREVWDLVDATC